MFNRIKPTTRRGRLFAGLLSFLLVVGIGGAVAAVLSQTGIKGQVGRGQFIAQWAQDGTVNTYSVNADGSIGSAVGTSAPAPKSTDGKFLTLPTGLEAFHGEALAVSGRVQLATGSSRSGYLSGVTTSAALPAGWVIELAPSDCGALVSATTPKALNVLIRPTSDTGPGLDLTALNLSVVATALPQGTSTPPTGVTCSALGS